MDFTQFEAKIIDYLEGNLSEQEARLMKEYVESNELAGQALEETKALLEGTDDLLTREPGSALRANFMNMLEEEKQLQDNVRPITSGSDRSWKTAFQIAASLLLLIAGYGMGRYALQQTTDDKILALEQESELLKQNVMMALIENRSASKRIQAVNYVQEFATPDSEVLNALIDRMHYDANVNVRLAAAEALSGYSDNAQVKDAFIEALGTEKDPGIQIAIIQFLVEVKDTRARGPMQQLLEQEETPNFVKDQVSQGLSNLM